MPKEQEQEQQQQPFFWGLLGSWDEVTCGGTCGSCGVSPVGMVDFADCIAAASASRASPCNVARPTRSFPSREHGSAGIGDGDHGAGGGASGRLTAPVCATPRCAAREECGGRREFEAPPSRPLTEPLLLRRSSPSASREGPGERSRPSREAAWAEGFADQELATSLHGSAASSEEECGGRHTFEAPPSRLLTEPLPLRRSSPSASREVPGQRSRPSREAAWDEGFAAQEGCPPEPSCGSRSSSCPGAAPAPADGVGEAHRSVPADVEDDEWFAPPAPMPEENPIAEAELRPQWAFGGDPGADARADDSRHATSEASDSRQPADGGVSCSPSRSTDEAATAVVGEGAAKAAVGIEVTEIDRLRALVLELFLRHANGSETKLEVAEERVTELFAKYEGLERELYARLCQKYGEEPQAAFAHRSEGQASVEGEPPRPPDAPAPAEEEDDEAAPAEEGQGEELPAPPPLPPPPPPGDAAEAVAPPQEPADQAASPKRLFFRKTALPEAGGDTASPRRRGLLCFGPWHFRRSS